MSGTEQHSAASKTTASSMLEYKHSTPLQLTDPAWVLRTRSNVHEADWVSSAYALPGLRVCACVCRGVVVVVVDDDVDVVVWGIFFFFFLFGDIYFVVAVWGYQCDLFCCFCLLMSGDTARAGAQSPALNRR